MDDVDLRSLRYYIAVAEELNFTRAAQRLNMAQPPLSRAIRELERRIGAQLLERTTRSVSLTPSGQVLLSSARQVLDLVAATCRRTRRAADPVSRLIVTMRPGADQGLLDRIVAAYRAEDLPEVDFLTDTGCDRPAMLRRGEADLAVLRQPFDDVGLDAEPLVTEPRVAAIAAAHPLARIATLSVADLIDQPVTSWPDTGWADLTHTLAAVAAGTAVAYLPASVARRHARPELVYRTVRGLSGSTVAIAWAQHARSTEVAAFVRAAVEQAGVEPVELFAAL